MRQLVTDWAHDAGVQVQWPEEYVQASGFRNNPCVDFGRFLHKTPGFVLQPASVEQLCECLRFLTTHRIPYKTRGSAHSSGGQVLIAGGAVVDLTRLCRLVSDHPDAEEVTVQGGQTWLALADYLRLQNRRPLALTDNLRVTVGGTLAVGGIGDTALHYGLQLGAVQRLTLVTPDGTRRELGPSDSLFGYVLGGRGQLGVLAEVTLRTMRRPAMVTGRLLGWPSLERFIADALVIREHRLYEFLRATLLWSSTAAPHPVQAIAGNFTTTPPPSANPDEPLLHPEWASPVSQSDRLEHAQRDPIASWDYLCPSLELILPIADGLATFHQLARRIVESGLPRYLPLGTGVMVLPTDRRFPVAPFPAGDLALVLALRPQMKSLDEVRMWLPLLRRLGMEALAAGGKIYLMSIDVESPRFAGLQFGSHLEAFRNRKNELDPMNLCNAGLLEPAG